MEQFDRENQAALTQAQAQCRDADCVIAAAGGKRWEWPPLYKPVIELALKYRLPLIAANVSRADAGEVIGGPPPPLKRGRLRGGGASILRGVRVAAFAAVLPNSLFLPPP